jgi:uncharacterized protein with GYD domain
MPSYVSLINWTDQGIGAFAETTQRAEAAEELAEQLGGSLREIYWCLGPHDIVGILDMPDDESATAFALKLSSLGNVRTSTMRAFTSDEVTKVIEKAG